MAGSQSFGKRENEKKKKAKRLQKQKRKDERKATAGSGSLDDMIAYVDENGMLTDTKPEDGPREEISLDEIEISVPKKEDTGPDILKGRVEYFNSDKGYGFIKDLATTEKYFFHISSAPADIKEGQKVDFEIERGQRGMNAVRISVTK
ncbi:MAG: cold shock domain-containing protein [Alistipes sp.]|nr:cold shock domain-containing protein [Alistipes sp.]MCD7970497.1 cold shock domain-containing protein [Alistipes sp.]